VTTFKVVITADTVRAYCELLGDVDPLQFQKNQAQLAGFKDPLIPGTVWSCLLLQLAHRLGLGEWEQARITYQKWTVCGQEYDVDVDEQRSVLDVRDQQGRSVLRARLDPPSVHEVLQASPRAEEGVIA
jgi:hypothetical protein